MGTDVRWAATPTRRPEAPRKLVARGPELRPGRRAASEEEAGDARGRSAMSGRATGRNMGYRGGAEARAATSVCARLGPAQGREGGCGVRAQRTWTLEAIEQPRQLARAACSARAPETRASRRERQQVGEGARAATGIGATSTGGNAGFAPSGAHCATGGGRARRRGRVGDASGGTKAQSYLDVA